jgi:hypothetical protein
MNYENGSDNNLDSTSQCLANMIELERNKNPIANVEKKESLKFEMSATMNAILQALKNNSL